MGNAMSGAARTSIKNWLALVALAAGMLPGPAVAQEGGSESQKGEVAYMVREYRYEPPAGESGNLEIGQSLCGTRCNALSARFESYIKPRGWRLIKTAGDVELAVELDNPFLKGRCLCLGDEYRIDWFDPVVPENRAGAKANRPE